MTPVEIAIEAVKLLNQTYMPTNTWPEKATDCVTYEYNISRGKFSEELHIIRIMHKMGYEPKYLGHEDNDVIITCEGLP
ncbi:hypothetical protein EU527_19275 [Candidatus Thorarchaeota archaeon]|nr:MAG: hypothetical protein EU527_19275 [Candidatus Thorarchaeota archaeon]